SLLSNPRDAPPCSAAARQARGHPAARGPLHAQSGVDAPSNGRGEASDGELQLAGQYPRAAERRRRDFLDGVERGRSARGPPARAPAWLGDAEETGRTAAPDRR